MNELNNRKILLIAIAGAVIFFLFVLTLILGGGGGEGSTGPGSTPTDDEKELTIWAVGMPTRIFEQLSDDFNSYYETDIQVKAKNFGSFEDYIDVLPRVIQDGNSPDIFVVPNNGGFTTMRQYIQHLDEDMVDLKEFEKQFHPHFPEQLVFEEKRQVEGTQQLVRGLKGVPVGFETLGIYYNNNIIKGIPKTWEELPELVREPLRDEQISALGMGRGHGITMAADVLMALLVQKGEEAIGYEKFNSIPSRSVIDEYMEYRREPNNLDQFEEDFQRSLTATDLFVRGEVAAIVGYPSTYRDIQLAMKRADKDDEQSSRFERFLKWGYLPQKELPEDDEDLLNVTKYYYFSLSNTAKHPRNGLLFLRYLMTKEAQETFFDEYEYYLPARVDLLEEHQKSTIDEKGGTRQGNMIVSDFYSDRYRFASYDLGIPHLYRYIVAKSLDEPGTLPERVASNAVAFLECKIRQALEGDNYDQGCECRIDVDQSNTNYWPVCERGGETN